MEDIVDLQNNPRMTSELRRRYIQDRLFYAEDWVEYEAEHRAAKELANWIIKTVDSHSLSLASDPALL